MNEYEAWLHIAEAFKTYEPKHNLLHFEETGTRRCVTCAGLCDAIAILRRDGRIDLGTCLDMMEHIEQLKMLNSIRFASTWPYYWPLNHEGAAARVAQAMKFANEAKLRLAQKML